MLWYLTDVGGFCTCLTVFLTGNAGQIEETIIDSSLLEQKQFFMFCSKEQSLNNRTIFFLPVLRWGVSFLFTKQPAKIQLSFISNN